MRRWLVVPVLLLLVAGCSGGSDSNGGGADRAGSSVAARKPPASSGSTLQHRDVVRTAALTVVTAHIDRAADSVVSLTTRAGGRVDGDTREHSGRTRTADIVLRVPPPALNHMIGDIDALGRETSRTVHGTDQTAAKADIDARATELATSVARLRQFMSRAVRVTDLITLENDLTQRQGELESLRGQQGALGDQIQLATLTVSLIPPTAPPHKPKPTRPAGFGAAFGTGLHGLAVTIRWLLAALGYALPVLLIAGLAAGAVLEVRRRRRPAPR